MEACGTSGLCVQTLTMDYIWNSKTKVQVMNSSQEMNRLAQIFDILIDFLLLMGESKRYIQK